MVQTSQFCRKLLRSCANIYIPGSLCDPPHFWAVCTKIHDTPRPGWPPLRGCHGWGMRRLAIRVTGDLGFRFDTSRPGWPHSDGVMDGAGEARNRSYRRFESHPAFYDTTQRYVTLLFYRSVTYRCMVGMFVCGKERCVCPAVNPQIII